MNGTRDRRRSMRQRQGNKLARAGAWISAGLWLAVALPAQTDWVRARLLEPSGAAMAYDAGRQRVVLFGGNSGSDTWEWDGVSWAQQNPANSPSPRSGTAMAYDAARQRVVLFGGGIGFALFGDTWEWDGVTWSQRNPPANPFRRAYHALAYDAARQRVVLFGGWTGSP